MEVYVRRATRSSVQMKSVPHFFIRYFITLDETGKKKIEAEGEKSYQRDLFSERRKRLAMFSVLNVYHAILAALLATKKEPLSSLEIRALFV